MCYKASRSAFTLIELLIVIAIIAVLAIVVVLTLNPVALLQQGRDSNRVSDMATLNSAINLYNTDQSGSSGYSLGSSTVVYVSISNPNASTTAGSNCSSLGLPTLPSTYSYHCAGPNYYRNINGTGWIPVNLSNISAGTSLGNLPVDPTNSSSSRLYYTYATNGSQFETTAVMESAKYGVGGSNDVISTDGGLLASVYEKGSQLGLEPLDYGDPSLVGWWPLNEGTGTSAYDDSGNNSPETWNGNLISGSHYAPGKVGPYAGNFDGSTNEVNNSASSPNTNLTNGFTISAWVYPAAGTWTSSASSIVCKQGVSGYLFRYNGNGPGNSNIEFAGAGAYNVVHTGTILPGATWSHLAVAGTFGGAVTVFMNGVSVGTGTLGIPSWVTNRLEIGGCSYGGYPLTGLIDDVRIYNRALSAAQIAAMYNGGK